jgi:hypothetical protein
LLVPNDEANLPRLVYPDVLCRAPLRGACLPRILPLGSRFIPKYCFGMLFIGAVYPNVLCRGRLLTAAAIC